jgi:beta-glucosidase
VVFSASTSDIYTLFVDGKEIATRKGPDARHPSEFPVKMEKGKEYLVELRHQKGKYVSITLSLQKRPRKFCISKRKSERCGRHYFRRRTFSKFGR